MNGGVADEKQVFLRSALSHGVKLNGYSDNGCQGASPYTDIIKSLETRLAGYLPSDSSMGENGNMARGVTTVTDRYNCILSRSPTSPGTATEEERSKMKASRRYKHSQLDWARTREESKGKRNRVNGHYGHKSKHHNNRVQSVGETHHVRKDRKAAARNTARYGPFETCTETRNRTASTCSSSSSSTRNAAEQLTISQVMYTRPSTEAAGHYGAAMAPVAAASPPDEMATGHACSVCGKVFSSYEHLSSHIVTHIQAASQPTVRCPFCNDSFNDPVTFFEHTTTHVDENPFQTVFTADKEQPIRTRSQESIKESDHLSLSVSIGNQPTSGRRRFICATETQSERSKMFEQDASNRRCSVNAYDSNATASDASADSGVSSPRASGTHQSPISLPVSFSVSPLTSAHSVTKTHFCFTGSAAGAMSSIEKSYDYSFSPTSATVAASVDTGNATDRSPSRVVDFSTRSVCSDSGESLSPSFHTAESPTSDTGNVPSISSGLPVAPLRESDTQEIRQRNDILLPSGFSSLSERSCSSRGSLSNRRRRRLSSIHSDTAVSNHQSDDKIGHGDYIPARRNRAGSYSGCLQLPRPQAVTPSAPTSNNVCSTCGKSFRLRAYLRIHQRLHTGELPYPCHVCGKRFNQSWNRNVHMRVHSGIHPHRCKLCCKNFRSAVRLREHLSVIHCLSEDEIVEKMKQSALEDMANEMHGRA